MRIMKNCRACGSSKTGLLFEIEQRRVRRCKECTHVYLDVRHSTDSLRGMYSAYGNGGQSQYFSGIDRTVEENLDSYLRRCKAVVQDRSTQLHLLDVGCGNGALLRRARALDFAITGVEISASLAQLARSE